MPIKYKTLRSLLAAIAKETALVEVMRTYIPALQEQKRGAAVTLASKIMQLWVSYVGLLGSCGVSVAVSQRNGNNILCSHILKHKLNARRVFTLHKKVKSTSIIKQAVKDKKNGKTNRKQ